MASKELLSSARILIVDDDPDILTLYRTLLGLEGYANIRTTSDSCGVLAMFVEYEPDILILDIAMPHLDGLQLLKVLQGSVQGGLSLPVLVATAYPSADNRFKALSGGAIEVLSKPFDRSELVLRVNNLLQVRMAVHEVEAQTHAMFLELLERTEQLSSYQVELKEAQLEVIERLARAAEQHDGETARHTHRVSITAGLLARCLGLSPDEAQIIQRAAPLHDVGKIGVPDSILLKPGKFTPQEYAVMQRHCRFGADLLSGGRSEVVQMAECIALTHHEKWDGQGYPHGLQGEEVPIEGRIVSVADVFDALTHDRPYKEAWPLEEALQEIRLQSGVQFDPQVVKAFMLLPHGELV